MISYGSYVNLIQHIDDLIAVFEQHDDEKTREQVVALLGGLDALHREGLRRLVDVLREAGGQEFLERAAADPIVETLLGLYELIDLGLPEEEKPPAAGGFVPLDEVDVFTEADDKTQP